MDFQEILMTAAQAGAKRELVPGNNIVVGNGAFANATGWTLVGGQEGGPAPTISGGTLNFVSSASDDARATCTATETIIAGTYRVSGTVTSYGRGSVTVKVGGSSLGVGPIGAAGAFSFDGASPATLQTILVVGDASDDEGDLLSIDNLSVRLLS